MTRKLIIGFIIVVFAVVGGLALKATTGYALFAYNSWTVEMPLWFFILSALIFILALHYLWRGLLLLTDLPNFFQSWHHKHHVKKAHSITAKGLLALIEARWSEAEKLLLQGVKRSHIPAINYLGAALASQEQNSYKRRDDYLAKAHTRVPEEEIAISLVQAKLQLDHHQLEQALATLQRLHRVVPKHKQVLKLLAELYLKTKDWDNLLIILPGIQKTKILSEDELQQLAANVYSSLLNIQTNLEGLQHYWSIIPKKLRLQKDILIAFCRQSLKFHQDNMVTKLIKDFLNKDWNDELVELYGLAVSSQPEKQLAIAEGWLKSHKNSAMLYVTLGRIAAGFKHWAKAEEYLKASLRLQPFSQAHAILGSIYQSTDRLSKALEQYQKSLAILPPSLFK